MMNGGGIRIEKNRIFGTGGGRDLKCNIFTPEDLNQPSPVVLLIHGGGWRRGNRNMMENAASHLAHKGYVCIASEYRLNTESRWPAQIEDVKAAIRWIRANARELSIDPEMICLQGHSAGAHLALHAAGTPNMSGFSGNGGNPGVDESVAAAAGIYSPVRFSMPGEKLSGATPLRALIGNESGSVEEAKQASPIEYVSADFPPTILLHGTEDKVVPPSSSMRMYEALVAARAPVELHMLSELPHGFARQGIYLAVYEDIIDFFFKRYVAAPEKLAGALKHSTAVQRQSPGTHETD